MDMAEKCYPLKTSDLSLQFRDHIKLREVIIQLAVVIFSNTRVTDIAEITEIPTFLLNLFKSSRVTAVKDQLTFCPLQQKMTEKVAAKAKNLFVRIFVETSRNDLHKLMISSVFILKE